MFKTEQLSKGKTMKKLTQTLRILSQMSLSEIANIFDILISKMNTTNSSPKEVIQLLASGKYTISIVPDNSKSLDLESDDARTAAWAFECQQRQKEYYRETIVQENAGKYILTCDNPGVGDPIRMLIDLDQAALKESLITFACSLSSHHEDVYREDQQTYIAVTAPRIEQLELISVGEGGAVFSKVIDLLELFQVSSVVYIWSLIKEAYSGINMLEPDDYGNFKR